MATEIASRGLQIRAAPALRKRNQQKKILRAKGTLISEPRFSTPCEMRFFPREKGKTAVSKRNPQKMAIFPFSRGKNRILQGVENRGSLISVPLAHREKRVVSNARTEKNTIKIVIWRAEGAMSESARTRSFVLFGALLQTLFCAHLRVSASDRV